MSSSIRKSFYGVASLVAATIGLGGAAQAEFPEKPIEFVIPFGAGGSADIEGRLLADGMSKVLGVPVVPVNKTGGGGAVTYTYLKNAKPDGYTVAWSSTSILTSSGIGNMPFDHTALDHLGQVEFQPMIVSVKGDAQWETFKQFADYCKANPGKLTIANSGTGSATHIAAVAVVNAMDCEVVHLPVGIKRRNATVLSGEADAAVGPLTATLKLAKAGKLRMLTAPTAERNPVVPDLPTMKELGYDADLDLFRSLSVPKGTPKEVVDKLTDAMIQAAQSAPFQDLAKKNGFTIKPLTGADFDARLKKDGDVVISIMKSAGIYQSKAQ